MSTCPCPQTVRAGSFGRWPLVPECCRCSQPLDNVKRSEYPVGHGAYEGECSICKVSTWFDLESELAVAA